MILRSFLFGAYASCLHMHVRQADFFCLGMEGLPDAVKQRPPAQQPVFSTLTQQQRQQQTTEMYSSYAPLYSKPEALAGVGYHRAASVATPRDSAASYAAGDHHQQWMPPKQQHIPAAPYYPSIPSHLYTEATAPPYPQPQSTPSSYPQQGIAASYGQYASVQYKGSQQYVGAPATHSGSAPAPVATNRGLQSSAYDRAVQGGGKRLPSD